LRDVLTILAGLLILVLAAALAVPPVVDWPAHRAVVDEAIARAVGAPAKTEGALELRLLPTPRLRADRVTLGSPGGAGFDASGVEAELALTPLLHGEVRILAAKASRAELQVPLGTAGDWRVPAALLDGTGSRRGWIVEDFKADSVAILSRDPRTGATEKLAVEAVRVEAQSLAGPWRIGGRIGGVPFDVATGEIAPDLSATLKGSVEIAGGRATLDARFRATPGAAGDLTPSLAGTVRFAAAPARDGPTLPLLVQTAIRAERRSVDLDEVSIELGEGAGTLRLAGAGRYDGETGRVRLNLDGRRLDLDALGGSGAGHLAAWRSVLGLPLDLHARLDSVAFGGEELSGASVRAALANGRLVVEDLGFVAPGPTRVSVSGETGLLPGAAADGRVRLSARTGDRFAAYLGKLGLAHPVLALLDGHSLEASADVASAGPVTSLRNLKVELGDAVLSGLVRFTAAEAGGRPRIDAQLAAQNFDVLSLSESGGLGLRRGLDFGLTLDARGLRYGAAAGAGRVRGRIVSEGPSLVIERLDIVDLAGADGTLSGRVSPDGTGRIEGRVAARRAAPVIDLIGRPWLGGLVGYVPPFLRAGELNLAITAERAAGAGSVPAIRTVLNGTLGGGAIQAEIVTAAGRTRAIAATLSTASTGLWLGGDPSRLRLPSRIDLRGERAGSDGLAIGIVGEIAGVRIRTTEPLLLSADEERIAGAAMEIQADDLSPLLTIAGVAVAPGVAVPLAAQARLVRVGEGLSLVADGSVAGTAVRAELAGGLAELKGSVTAARLSLPWLASALALRMPPGPSTGWSSARFGPAAELPASGSLRVRAAEIDLGRGLSGSDASFELATTPDGFSVRDLAFGMAGGRVSGSFALGRQGGLASLVGQGEVRDLALPALIRRPATAGRLSGELRFGASGESAAGLVSNLGGAGSLEIAGVQLAAADPAGVERAALRSLRSDDPLASNRLAALVAAEIGRAPFSASHAAAPATMVGGGLRIGPLSLSGETGAWTGVATVDLRSATLEMRGSLQARTAPRGWTGPPPAIQLGWAGPLADPAPVVSVAPLTNGLAQAVLARELERIEVFELDAAERARLNARVEFEKARRAAEEAARLARVREQEAERARLEAERARAAAGAAGTPPVDIRPPAQTGSSGG
jgi:hypothetical protein